MFKTFIILTTAKSFICECESQKKVIQNFLLSICGRKCSIAGQGWIYFITGGRRRRRGIFSVVIMALPYKKFWSIVWRLSLVLYAKVLHNIAAALGSGTVFYGIGNNHPCVLRCCVRLIHC